MGTVLKNKGKLEEAIRAYIKAIEIKPDYLKAYNNMGNAFKEKQIGRGARSIPKAISLNLIYAEAYTIWGNALTNKASCMKL